MMRSGVRIRGRPEDLPPGAMYFERPVSNNVYFAWDAHATRP